MVPVRLASSGLLAINLTAVVELAAFLLMLAILARYIYPPVMRAAEARQQRIAAALQDAEQSREQAQQRLEDAEAQVGQARVEGQQIIEASRRSAEYVAQQVKDRAEEEAKRIAEQARQNIEAERQRAAYALREQVAELVVSATRKVIGEVLTTDRHRTLIERAVAEVGAVAEGEPNA